MCEASKGVDVERDITTLMSLYQNAGQNHNINIANTVFGNVAKFEKLVSESYNKDCIHEGKRQVKFRK
jgi:hypothetical protein